LLFPHVPLVLDNSCILPMEPICFQYTKFCSKCFLWPLWLLACLQRWRLISY